MSLLLKIITLLSLVAYVLGQFNKTFLESEHYGHAPSRTLTRRKRFLIFPEGSSVQLVFCLTYPAIFAVGDIFLWGYTAALAYELPQDPYSPFNHKADPLHRRADSKTIYYTDDDGLVLFKRPYKKKTIVNPAFAKRSIDETGTQEKFKIDRKQMHALNHKREFLKREHMDERSVEFHRSARVELYRKIETLLDGLQKSGHHCVLKTLCLVGQNKNTPQASFFQEITRAIFTLPEGKNDENAGNDSDYDQAVLTKESCDDLYPECIEFDKDIYNTNVN